MPDQPFNYEKLVERAMRGVARDALREAAENGLAGDHHFFIGFRTGAPDVELPGQLAAQYPDDMTIVIQHQYWNLLVDEVGFSVDLAFGGKREHLYIPYAALTSFVDPSCEFGLQFTQPAAGAAAALEAPEAGEMLPAPEAADQQPGGHGETETGGEAASAGSSADGDDASEKVVSLDQFRKK